MSVDGREKSSENSGFKTLLGLGVILLGAGALYLFVRAVWESLTSASPQLASAIVGAGGLIFVALIANVYSKQVEHKRQIQQEQRNKKAEVYQEFMAFWFRVLTGKEEENGSESSVPQEEQDKYVTEFTYKLVTWGSESFLKDYVSFKENMKQGGASLDFEKVLFAIRADLGYSNKGLKQGDLLKVFLDSPGVDSLLLEGVHS